MSAVNHEQFPHNEEIVIEAVRNGEFEVDAERGEVWRLMRRQCSGKRELLPCERCRAEKWSGNYLLVRAFLHGRRVTVNVQRLIWRHVNGKILGRLEVNHKDGNPRNNRLDNLELATRSENMIHSFRVLKRKPVRVTRISDDTAREILRRRRTGESPTTIAREFSVHKCTVNDIFRRRSFKHIEAA